MTDDAAADRTKDHIVYRTLSLLLQERSLIRLDLSVFACGDALNVGLHAGFGDGDLVIGVGPNIDGDALTFQHGIDTDAARDLAAALMAWSDWCDATRMDCEVGLE